MKNTTLENLIKHLPKRNQPNSKKARIALQRTYLQRTFTLSLNKPVSCRCVRQSFTRVIHIQRRSVPAFKLKKKKNNNTDNVQYSVILKAYKIWEYCPDCKNQKSFLKDVKTKQNIKYL